MKSKITKTILLLAFIGLSFTKVNAQFVTIPDANFVTWLTTNYPNCMTGNQMDTTCAGIVNATLISVTDINNLFPDITDLTGVQYFDNLQSIDCSYNSLTTIPHLPNTVTALNCSANQITSIAP